MTIDPNLEKSVKDAEKPDLTLAMELANYVHEEIAKLDGKLTEQIRTTRNDNAKTVKRIDEMEFAFNQLKQDLEQRAHERADKELKEAAARYQIALEHKDGLTTQEKIEVSKVMEERANALEKARADRRRTFWQDKVLPGVTTALIISIVGPVGLGLFIAILVFILRALGLPVQFP